MENKEFGWCEHVKGSGVLLMKGTALKVESDQPVFIVPASSSVLIVMCPSCFRMNNYHLVQFGKDSA